MANSLNIKLVLTDVDGTLTEAFAHTVSDDVRKAVIAAEDAGIKVVPVTGRPYNMGLPIFNLLGFNDLCVVDNGATIRKVKTGEIVWSQWLSVDTIRSIIKIVAPLAAIIDYDAGQDEHKPVADEHELVQESAADVYATIPVDSIPKVEQALSIIPDIHFYWAKSARDPGSLGVQITHKLGTKFHGIEVLREHVGIPLQNTLGIGDGINDLALFENSGLKIAMGNSVLELKSAADHIVADVEHDGFVEAMQKFVLK